MIWVPAMILGAVSGAVFAKRRGGSRADMAQFGAVWAIALGLAAVIVSIAIDRMIH